MTNRKTDEEITNPILYRYIQMAYEHTQSFSVEDLSGDPEAIRERLYYKRKLGQIYARRLASVFGNLLEEEPPLDEEFSLVQEWFQDERARQVGNIITAQIGDLEIGRDSEDLFEQPTPEYEKKFREDAEEGRVYDLGTEAYATYLPIHFFFGDVKSYKVVPGKVSQSRTGLKAK